MAPSRSDIETIVKAANGGPSPWRRAAWGLVLVAVAAGLWFWWTSGSRQAQPLYITQPVERTDIVVQVTATGTVEPTDLVEISSELSGTVRSVEADFNDLVTKGQILARLDTDKLEANVELSKASLTASKARMAEATATLNEMNDNYERALLLEQNDEWAVQRARHMTLESVAPLSDDLLVSLSATAH